MRIIKLDVETEKAPRYTFCVYGPTGSGKTTFAGSFPRPVFLSEATESGYESLRGVSDENLFEPGVKPIVLGIEKMNDMALARAALAPHIASGMVQTVVIDSMTFYADLYLNHLFTLKPNENNLRIYGDLGKHLQDLRVQTHTLGCNVVNLCLPQDPTEESPNGLPSIPGKQAAKIGAGCDFLFYTTHEHFKQGNVFVDHYKVHSKPFGKFVARARRAAGQPELPSPLINTNYADLIAHLGFDLEATRAALPAYKDPTAAIEAFLAASTRTVAPPAAAAAAAPHAPTAAAPRHTPTAARPVNGRPQPTVIRRPGVPAKTV